jgi:hypothetical protein
MSSELLAQLQTSKVKTLLGGVLPALPPTEALAHLLSIFFAIFGDINDETTDALIKLNDVTTRMSWAPSRRLTLWLRGLRGY